MEYVWAGLGITVILIALGVLLGVVTAWFIYRPPK